MEKAGMPILVHDVSCQSHTYIVIWNPFCGSLFLHKIWDLSYASIHNYVTNGSIWYVG